MIMEAEASHQLSPSPSFNSYSSETLAQIAARVIHEFRSDPDSSLSDDPLFDSWEHHDESPANGVVLDDDDDEFEFTFVCRDPHSSPVSADDIFSNGQIRPMYPLFDRSLLDGVSPTPTTNETAAVRRRRLPLRKLMFEERETGSCSSSTSEAEDIDLDGVAPGTYCVWDPKSSSSSSSSESMRKPCKKSSSTGSSSKRWKFRDLLPRSQSDGKEPLVLLTPSKRNNKVSHEVPKPSSGENNAVEKEAQCVGAVVGPAKESDESKKKPSLPYRQEFIGLFTNVNGLGRNLRPF